MSKSCSGRRRKRRGSGRAACALFSIVLGLFLVEQVWIHCFDGIDIHPSLETCGAAMQMEENDMRATEKPLVWATQAPAARPTGQFVAQPTAKPAAKPTVRPTAQPTARPTAEPTRVSVVTEKTQQNALDSVRPETKTGFLPLINGKRTEEKIVALTIDDCNQADNLREIIRLISDYDGRATIFPIGDNVSFLGGILRSAVSSGFEIENHTMSHAGLYSESDRELAEEIWGQNRAVSEALGVDYQMHFLRPRGGDNRYDQRTHAYMRQMGYYGIAYWAQVGSGSSADEIMRNLQPGDIILFHTTDQDLATLRALIPRLHAAEYRMVTLNEMFDLPDNEQSPLGDEPIMPLQPYERIDQTLKRGDYLHDVLLMQQRLEELRYFDGKYNGYFGKETQKAVKAFQEDEGLTVDGMCGPATWRALFGQ